MSIEAMNERRLSVFAAQTFFCHHRLSWAGRRCVDGAAVVRGHLMRQTAAQSPSRNLLSFCSVAALDRTGPRDLASKARADRETRMSEDAGAVRGLFQPSGTPASCSPL